MNKYSTIIFLILLFQVISSHFTWAQSISACSDLQNNLPRELATLNSSGLRAVTIQLIEQLDGQRALTDAEIGYYSQSPQLYYILFSKLHYSQLSEIYDCMVAAGRWVPMIERGRIGSTVNQIFGTQPNKMTRGQLQDLPSQVIRSIWLDLHITQIPWVTAEQLNYYLGQGGTFDSSDEMHLTKEQIQGINQENIQSALNRFNIYRWYRWFSDEQISWLSLEQLHNLILDIRKQDITEEGPIYK